MRKSFDFYPYGYPKSGIYYDDDNAYFMHEDHCTVKRFQEFKNVGFTMALLQSESTIDGSVPFEKSECARTMKVARKAGIKRMILSDTRLKLLCEEEVLVGEGGRFANDNELEAYLLECTAPYRNEEGFYGLQLRDEPKRHMLVSYGKVCRALKKVIPNVYLQCNLFPITDVLQKDGEDIFEAYENYLNEFLQESQMDSILFDEYPFRVKYIIGGHSIRTRQIVARVCKKWGVEFRMVLQSFSMTLPNSQKTSVRVVCRAVREPDMYWQSNLAMGFGCTEYSYFTYTARAKNWFTDEYNPDGASFINRDGTRSKLYYYTKRIIREMKRFAPIQLAHKYENCWFAFEEGKTAKDFMQTEFAEINEACPIDVKVNQGVVIITKLSGQKTDLYMVQNVGNVKDEYFDGVGPVVANINLGEKAKAKVYKCGKKVKRKIIDGKFDEKLHVGDAIFVLVDKK